MYSRHWGSKAGDGKETGQTTELSRVQRVSLFAWKLCSIPSPSLLICQPFIRSPECPFVPVVQPGERIWSHRRGAEGTKAERQLLIQNICALISIRCWGRTTQMWPNSWTTWPCCVRTRASTKRWSTTTAVPWRSMSAGWVQMIPTWPKLRTTWWERSSYCTALFFLLTQSFYNNSISVDKNSGPPILNKMSKFLQRSLFFVLCLALKGTFSINMGFRKTHYKDFKALFCFNLN